jgi:hypothetical protein
MARIDSRWPAVDGLRRLSKADEAVFTPRSFSLATSATREQMIYEIEPIGSFRTGIGLSYLA